MAKRIRIQVGARRRRIKQPSKEACSPPAHSNPLAPTNDFKHLERVLVESVLFFLFSRRCDRRYSLKSAQLIP